MVAHESRAGMTHINKLPSRVNTGLIQSQATGTDSTSAFLSTATATDPHRQLRKTGCQFDQMASPWRAPEDELACPVCHDIYSDPVLLSCSHSFCSKCLENWWNENTDKACPVCKRCCASRKPPRNLALRNLCESFRRRGDAGPSVRPQAKRQKTITAFPVVAASLALKAEIKKTVEPLKDKREVFREFQSKNTEELLKHQERNLVSTIRGQYGVLRGWLDVDEESRVAAVADEARRRCESVNEKNARVSKSVSTLSKTIALIEGELKADDIAFLNNYETTKERAKCELAHADCPEWESLDSFGHTGNLLFRVWEKMKDTIGYHPVLLDPASVHAPLLLSADMATLSRGPEPVDLGDGLGEGLATGCEVITSGAHCWDVEVGDSPGWSIGVIEGLGVSGLPSNPRLSWGLELSQGKYGLVCFPSGNTTEMKFMRNPRKIRVKVDWSAGQLSFSDPETRVLIHAFEHSFANGLTPYVHTSNTHPLVMLPRKVGIAVCHETDDFNRPEVIDLDLVS